MIAGSRPSTVDRDVDRLAQASRRRDRSSRGSCAHVEVVEDRRRQRRRRRPLPPATGCGCRPASSARSSSTRRIAHAWLCGVPMNESRRSACASICSTDSPGCCSATAPTTGAVIECSPPRTNGNLPRDDDLRRDAPDLADHLVDRRERKLHLRQREDADAVHVGRRSPRPTAPCATTRRESRAGRCACPAT